MLYDGVELHRKKFYFDAIDSYELFIELIADFIRKLKIENNSITLSILIRELIYNGYFSDYNLFQETSEGTFYDIRTYEGMDIVNGKGCCRHLANFHSNLFKRMGIYNDNIYCYVCDFDTPKEFIAKEALFHEVNHVANLIMFNGKYYTYDCIRNCILKFMDEFLMEEVITNGGPYRFYYKTEFDMLRNHFTRKEMSDRLQKLRIDSKIESIDYKTYLGFKSDVAKILKGNANLFDDLKNESKVYTRKISDELKSGLEEEVIDFYS